tara:strand:- start:7958 stop:9328 length:1371 start_codon:yes stop_codon:yes gene_type:complete
MVSRTALALSFALVFLGPAARVFAHGGAAHAHDTRAPREPTRGLTDFWTQWTFDPWVLIGLAVASLLYWRGVRTLWRRAGRDHGVRRWQVVAFTAAIASLVFALISPLHAISEELFSVHMVQHLILMVVAAPLFILGDPLLVWLWAVPGRTRGRLLRWWRGKGWLRRVAAFLRHPLVVWAAYALVLWIWHLPSLFQATLVSDLIHGVQHSCFFAVSLLFWYTVVDFARNRRRTHGAAILLIFMTMMQAMALGVMVASADSLLYPIYGERTEPWGLDPVEDQQLAGLVMWMPPGVVYVLAVSLLVAAALEAAEYRTRKREQRQADRRESGKLPAPSTPLSILLLASWLSLSGCAVEDESLRPESFSDTTMGEKMIYSYGCTSCHVIPGISDANGTIGPPLDSYSQRKYIAGNLLNRRENMVRWLMHPQQVEPGTAMPEMGITQQQAGWMASYLETLK